MVDGRGTVPAEFADVSALGGYSIITVAQRDGASIRRLGAAMGHYALEYFYVLPVSTRAPGSLFEGLGPAVRFWIGLLAIALVRDYVVSRRDRSIVRPFANVLNPQPLPGDDSVTQVSDEAVLSTSTSGSVSDRMASVTFRDTANRTPNVLRVDVSCH